MASSNRSLKSFYHGHGVNAETMQKYFYAASTHQVGNEYNHHTIAIAPTPARNPNIATKYMSFAVVGPQGGAITQVNINKDDVAAFVDVMHQWLMDNYKEDEDV